jgi:broad specificity phosphatase PhoE
VSLLIVRHGQAQAGTDDYDRLSERGREQSRRLGHWLAANGHRFDRIVVGGMRRHLQSVEALVEGYGEALPDPHVDAGFAEFDHHAVFSNFASANPDHPAVIGVRDGGLPAFGALIRAALAAWAQDRIEGLPETWVAFGDRVSAAGERLVEDDRRTLVMTSGGVISRLAQRALGADDPVAIDLNLSLRNSGLCEFSPRPHAPVDPAGRPRLGLTTWNALPHLHDARELWTYY